MNLRELAENDLFFVLEDACSSGSRFVLQDARGQSFDLIGQVGDVSYLLDGDGAPVQGRMITVSYRISSLAALTAAVPKRGWRVVLKDLTGRVDTLFVVRYEPDRTLGIGRLTLAFNSAGD